MITVIAITVIPSSAFKPRRHSATISFSPIGGLGYSSRRSFQLDDGESSYRLREQLFR